ncbi:MULTISPECIES: hypothetical protein [Streptomyces]|uniref:hypothetical protein n=1 Tax=unclassified Streptomyces TaxID=2593676 RepID=UPI0015EBB78C|nr:hypothetical protein [Streptomyces sp. PsTaAH-130]
MAARPPQIPEVLPLLHRRGLSCGDFVPAQEQFLGGTAWLSSGRPPTGPEADLPWSALQPPH